MENSNIYQVKKAIRFKLQPAESNSVNLSEAIEGNVEFNLPNFLIHLDDFIDQFNEYFFYKTRKGEWAVKENLIVKKDWVREYEKEEFNEWNARRDRGQKRLQLTIGDFYSVAENIQQTLDYISDDLLFELESDASAELNERAKRTRTALLLKRLKSKRVLPYLTSLVENVSDKQEKDNLRLLMQSKARQVMAELAQGIQYYLPEQSGGMPVAKASFNYYILNKKPIDFKQEIEKLVQNLEIKDVDTYSFGRVERGLDRKIKEDIKARLGGKKLFVGEAPMCDATEFNSLRQIMKNILAEQKAAFSEFMQKEPTYNDLRQNKALYLFCSIGQGEFERYANLTEQIEQESTKWNQSTNKEEKARIRSRIEGLKRRRGDLINAVNRNTRDMFVAYKAFADSYRQVAQRHGKILAKLKGVEIEQYESQLLSYWALMLEEEGRHRLVLVPRERASKAKSKVEQKRGVSGGDVKLYWFESFTFRSLRKLCFGNLDNGTNTFYPELKNDRDFFRKYSTLDRDGRPKFVQGEFEFKGDEQRIIQFYKDVLMTSHAQKNLNLPIKLVREQIINTVFESLDDFVIALERICYTRFVTTDKDTINYLKNECNALVFDIKSQDLDNAENTKDKEVKYTHHDKRHTQIWRRFWTAENEKDNFDLRLNPEITILYRKPKPSRVAKYGEGTENYDPTRKNRYLCDQYTLITTFTDHSNTPQKNLAFATDEEVKSVVDEFNAKLSMPRFAFGLDNGETELSTFGVYMPEFDKATNEEVIAELNNVDKYGFDTLRIKDLLYSEIDKGGRVKRIVLNPSYFVDEELYCRTFGKTHEEYVAMFEAQFEKRRLLTLDLTTAKVINGHIVENGDVATYFSLCMRSAQRSIYEMNDKAKEETARKIMLKRSETLDAKERRLFVDYLNEKNDKYKKLTNAEKNDYVGKLYAYWSGNFDGDDAFWKIAKGQRVGYFASDVVCGVSYQGEELEKVVDVFDVHNIFKLRKDFYSIKSEQEILDEIEKYNQTRVISNEELDLKLVNMKRAVVANVVGVVDKLYHEYAERFGGDGIIVKEGFDSKKEIEDRNKFEGNIYRMLERKLYQKFQNYGLVPPLKNLMMLRDGGIKDNRDAIMQVGIVAFVDPAGTSQECPVCVEGKLRHTTICPNKCGFTSDGIMHSNDGIAAYNIAKRGFNNLKNNR